MKICYRCEENKPLDFFPKASGNKDGHLGYCKKCRNKQLVKWKKDNPDKARTVQRKSNLKMKYGLSEEDFQEIENAQNSLCAICKQPPNGNGARFKTLFVDHNHTNNKVRGLLCHNCNVGLGSFRDNPALLFRAIEYLKQYS